MDSYSDTHWESYSYRDTQAQGVPKGNSGDASFAAWAAWAVSHPKGQLVCLFAFTLPFGIWALVTAQNSYDSLETAVSSFQSILDNWMVVPPTAIEAVARAASCSSGD